MSRRLQLLSMQKRVDPQEIEFIHYSFLQDQAKGLSLRSCLGLLRLQRAFSFEEARLN